MALGQDQQQERRFWTLPCSVKLCRCPIYDNWQAVWERGWNYQCDDIDYTLHCGGHSGCGGCCCPPPSVAVPQVTLEDFLLLFALAAYNVEEF